MAVREATERRAMYSLTNIGHPQQLIQRVADATLALVAGAEGVLVGLVDDGSLTFVSGAGYLTPRIGARESVQRSLAGLAVTSGQILRCDDAETDPRVDRQACQRFGVLSSVVVPMRRRGVCIGVVCVSSSKSHMFDDADVAVLDKLTELTSTVVGAAFDLATATSLLLEEAAAGPEDVEAPPLRQHADDLDDLERFVANVLDGPPLIDLSARGTVEQVLETGTLTFAYQPIFDLGTGQLAFVEALARFPSRPHRPPDEWFAAARRVGLGDELELTAVEVALESLKSLPASTGLSINVGPSAAASWKLLDLLSRIDGTRLVIELTEQVRVDDYPTLRLALMEHRRNGVSIAIDDAGAGYASLSHILKLAPDYIKLDLSLTQGIDVDPVRRALATALVNFAQETGAKIISEGVETEDELCALRALGVHFGQGYLLGRPGPIHTIPAALALTSH